MPSTPFYCNECLQRFEDEAVRDVTLDKPLMEYVFNGVIPKEVEIRERCKCTKGWLKYNEFGDLVVCEVDGRKREFPLIRDQ